jgi:hypothetical protein
MFGKTFLFFLAFAGIFSLRSGAQRARYTSIPAGYDLRIPENPGTLVHAWVASSQPSYRQSQKVTLTLYIFSPEMRLLGQRNIRLGKISAWNIDFQYTDSCYYASIYYNTDSLYHVLVKINNEGTVTDVGTQPQLWTKKDSFRQLHKIFALETVNNNLYSIKIENTDTSNSQEQSNVTWLEREPGPAGPNLQKIVIKKVNLKTKNEIQRTYASALQNFWSPFIHVTDNGIFAYSLAEPISGHSRNSAYNNNFMFVTRLDTSLNPAGPQFQMIKIAGPVKHKTFSPYNVFSMNNKTFIVNRGWDPDPGINYYSIAYNRSFGPIRVPINLDQTNSFRIMVLDGNNALLKDTILQDRSGDAPLRWDNRFIMASGKEIDFFFTRQFRASKNGMTHLFMNDEGKLTEEDIIVDEHYEYHLQAARKLSEGILLVPYGKNGRAMGIMKMQYDTDTP